VSKLKSLCPDATHDPIRRFFSPGGFQQIKSAARDFSLYQKGAEFLRKKPMNEECMTNEQRDALRRAFGAHLRSAADLLNAWRAGLSDERIRQLERFYDEEGLQIGLSVRMHGDRYAVLVVLTDVDKIEVAVLDTIEQTRLLQMSTRLRHTIGWAVVALTERSAGSTTALLQLPRSERIATAGREARSRTQQHRIARIFARGDFIARAPVTHFTETDCLARFHARIRSSVRLDSTFSKATT
jgi:hypothetical protein